MRTKLGPSPRLLGDQNPNLPSTHSACLNTPIDRTTTVLDTFIDRLDAIYAQLEPIYESLEKKETIIREDKRALESRNRELEKHTAELEAKYKRARASVFGLEVEQLALEERNKRLETTISNMCSTIDKSIQARDFIRTTRSICTGSRSGPRGYERRDSHPVPFYMPQEPCTKSWSEREGDESLIPAKLAEEICGKSWGRNEIIEARIPGENPEKKWHWESEACASDWKTEDIRAKPWDVNEYFKARTPVLDRGADVSNNANAGNTPFKGRFGTGSLKPPSDRRVHFEVGNDKTDSIQVKHDPDKPGDRQTGEAQLGTTSSMGTKDGNPFSGVPPKVFKTIALAIVMALIFGWYLCLSSFLGIIIAEE